MQAGKLCYMLGISYSKCGGYIIHQIFVLNVTGGAVFVWALVFIHSFTSIYPLTGASQGCGDSHTVIHNISVELQTS